MSVYFQDLFTGADDLSTHAPDVGAAYTLYGGTSLTDYQLNGAGSLQGADWFNASKAASNFTASPGPSTAYRLTTVFTWVTGFVGVETVDLALRVAGSDNRIVRILFSSSSLSWRLYQSGSQVFSNTPAITVSPGDTHTITIDVDPVGVICTLSIDGVSADTASGSGNMPNELPDSVRFQFKGDNHPGVDANFLFDALMVATPGEPLTPPAPPAPPVPRSSRKWRGLRAYDF